jgi:vacuolar protein sorting-associated protein VTA1
VNSFLFLFCAFSATMATHVPDKLKAADLTRFIVRAAQLEKVKPVMAYWCM